jgi:hypothetical protein
MYVAIVLHPACVREKVCTNQKVTTPRHTDRREGNATATTFVHQVGEPSAKRLKLHACEKDI